MSLPTNRSAIVPGRGHSASAFGPRRAVRRRVGGHGHSFLGMRHTDVCRGARFRQVVGRPVGRNSDVGSTTVRTIVNGRLAVTNFEFTELALGVDAELFTGVDGESGEERAARVDAAHDILTALWREDRELAAYAAQLLGEAPRVLVMSRRFVARRWAA